MHFITFPVATTNIFPLSNSTKGGQLVTEYNLKSREMVATNPEVTYAIGPSFVHSLNDFKVKLLEDTEVADYDATKTYLKGDYCRYENDTYICMADTTTGPFDAEAWKRTEISTSIVQVDPGRAVVNGHFVETLAPMIIDLKLANAELQRNSKEPLYGNLSIGIKSYFSTETTMSGSMLVENKDNMYVGIQLVVTKAEDFKTPNDCPTNYNDVVADLKLADFTYYNGAISPSSILQNADATRYIPSDRIYDFDKILSEKYVTSDNLVDRMFYTYSGKSGWCDSTGSLMIWDAHPYEDSRIGKIDPDAAIPTVGEAKFLTDTHGNVQFVVPHKQQDKIILDSSGNREYYKDKYINFPTASYANGTSGVVTKEYTQAIKNIANVINTYKLFTGGKQIMYLDSLSYDSEGNKITVPKYEIPKNLYNYDVGDYMIVRADFTVDISEDEGAAPSTMYLVLPGPISSVFYMAEQPSGIQIGAESVIWAGDDPTEEVNALEHLADSYNTETFYGVGNYAAYNGAVYVCITDTAGAWDASCWQKILDYDASSLLNYASFVGSINKDYFAIAYHDTTDSSVTYYYYVVSGMGPKTWSDAIMLTGGVPLATETQIGGFYNVADNVEDAGYVYLDETGHLKLRDYALLRTGTLAYQLGTDYTVPANSTLDYVQAYLDENVNDRIAFKTNAELTSTPTMINVTIPLPAGEDGILNVYDLDSRFGTGVYLHFTANDPTGDYSNIIINISDCEKVRIDSSVTTMTKGPVINVLRSCLYYDAEVINYIRNCDPNNAHRSVMFPAYTDFTGFDNFTLWYSRFTTSDPDLTVNGMEVAQPNVAMATHDIAFWDDSISSDNHYTYALRSITLSNNGRMIGCSLYVASPSTQTNLDLTSSHVIIGGDFILPQGSELNYPMACVNSPLQITGSFTTAYLNELTAKWIVTETSFTAKSGVYDLASGLENGSIAFNSKTDEVDATYTHGISNIEGWRPGTYHIFYGGTTVFGGTTT